MTPPGPQKGSYLGRGPAISRLALTLIAIQYTRIHEIRLCMASGWGEEGAKKADGRA